MVSIVAEPGVSSLDHARGARVYEEGEGKGNENHKVDSKEGWGGKGGLAGRWRGVGRGSS